MTCPICGRWAPPCPETGYDADDPCSELCGRMLEELEDRLDANLKELETEDIS